MQQCDQRPQPVFYGWWIVGVSFLAQCLTVGTVFYSFGVFFQPLSEHFGWTRAQVSWGFSTTQILGALYAPVVGRFVDRYGPRPVQLVGAAALGTGFLLLAGIQSLPQYYFCMGLFVAIGSASLGPMPSNAAVARWFVRRRGRALGISTAGISMGGVIFVPLTTLLITRFGWRMAFLCLGLLVLGVGIPPILRWMRRSPEDMGLRPDGLPAGRRSRAPGAVPAEEILEEMERSWTAREAMRSRNFWLLSVAFGLTIGALSSILLHQIPYLLDQGISPQLASWILGGTAAVGVLGKLGFGALIDRYDQRLVILGCFLAQALGVSVLLLAPSPALLALYVLLYGYAMGGNATLQATIVGECFGRLHYGAIAGRMSPILIGLQSLCVPFVGWIHDRTGSYTIAFVAIIVATAVAAGCIASLKLTPRTRA